MGLMDWVLAEIVFEAAQKSHICGVTGTIDADASRLIRSSVAVDEAGAAVDTAGAVRE